MTNRKAHGLREQLEQDIVMGVLAPGQRLDEVRLAERFAVSRTPIREAFHHLAATGLIDLQVRRGAFVRERGFAEIVEMFEVMGELEGMCGRLAARRIAPAQAERLRQLMAACTTMVDGGDSDAYYYANEDFHQLIYQAAGNGYLARQARQLQASLSPYRRLQLRVRDRLRQSHGEHGKIVTAILEGDGGRAEALLKGHVVVQGERFNDLLASLQGAAAE